MLGDPQEYRQHAMSCARRAASCTSPALRQKFEDLATVWLMRVLQLERYLDRPTLPHLDRS